jgi:hypothetical protein
MRVIAKALLLTTQYIERRDDRFTADDDVRFLEDVAAMLQNASTEERQAMINVAQELGMSTWPEQMGILFE